MTPRTATKARGALMQGRSRFRCSRDVCENLIRLWQGISGARVPKVIHIRQDLRGRNRLVVRR